MPPTLFLRLRGGKQKKRQVFAPLGISFVSSKLTFPLSSLFSFFLSFFFFLFTSSRRRGRGHSLCHRCYFVFISPSNSQILLSSSFCRSTTSQSTNQTTSQSTNQTTSQSTNQTTSQSTNQTTSQSTNQTTSQSTNQTTSQSTNQTTSQSTNQTTSQSTNQTTSQSTNQSTSQSTNQSTSQSTNQSTSQSTNQSTSQSINQLLNRHTPYPPPAAAPPPRFFRFLPFLRLFATDCSLEKKNFLFFCFRFQQHQNAKCCRRSVVVVANSICNLKAN